MNVILYLEKQADMGETCILLQQAGLTNIETKPDECAILGQIDARQTDQLLKVKGISHMRKGVYVQPPFMQEGEQHVGVSNSVVFKPNKGTAYKTFPTVTRVGKKPAESPKKKTKKKKNAEERNTNG